jgi:predicted Fe-Mo cluster-binding NifX family protein
MKIAAVSNDQSTISPHFGRARFYVVFTVENGEIVSREVRDKAGHHQFATGEHHHHHDHQDHDHGGSADQKHSRMVASILDCGAVLVGGMGEGARAALREAGITPCHTNERDLEKAVRRFLEQGSGREPECGSRSPA